MKTTPLILICICLIFVGFANPGLSATWVITPDGTGDAPTIQAGIDSAGAGDTVLVTTGVFSGDGNRDIDFGGKSVILMSQFGPDSTVIDAEGSYSDRHRVFVFQNGEDSTSAVIGVTLTGGYAAYWSPDFQTYVGGAVICLNASPTLRDCVFDDNTANDGGSGGGGAIAFKNSTAKVVDCTFRANNSYNGGAVYCDGASPSFTGCNFFENDARDGSAFYCRNGSAPSLLLCVFQNNSGSGQYSSTSGGAMYCAFSSPTITNCNFEQNRATSGGALTFSVSSALVEDCVFTGNAATYGPGGAIYCSGTSVPEITGNTITGNTAHNSTASTGYGGAGIACIDNADAIITDNTISDNKAARLDNGTGRGAGIFCRNADPTIDNNDIINNKAFGQKNAFGGGIFLEDSDATIVNNTFSSDSAEVDHTFPDAYARGGAIYCEDSNPVIGGSPANGNTFEGNHSWIGNDIYKTGGPAIVNARFNTFTIYPPSAYYVRPLAEFDVSDGSGLYPAITHDVVVSPAGSDTNMRSGAEVPFLTIQAALSRVLATAADPVTIHVTAGTYSPSATGEIFPLPIMDHVTVLGNGWQHSVVDAEQTNRVFYCEDIASAAISGMTIRGGRAGIGGGITCRSSSLRIECNNIEFNEGSWGGGIACFDYSDPEIVNNVIADNTYLHTYYFALIGGGILVRDYSNPRIANNLLVRNHSGQGGAIACDRYCDPEIVNNTICDNSATGSGGGLICWSSSNPTILNTIIWGNTADTDPSIDVQGGSTPVVTYSDVEGGWPDAGTNLDTNPGFNPSGRYHLSPGSPVIDAGDPDPAYNDVENPVLPGNALFPAMGTLHNDMGFYGGPGMKDIFESPSVAVMISTFVAEYSGRSVRLYWEIERAEGLKGFNVYRATGTDDNFERLTATPIGGFDLREYVDTGVRPGTTYWYQLGAVDSDGEFLSHRVSLKTGPGTLALYQNEPNPFNPSTTISFSLSQRSATKLAVYNIEGRLVTTIVDGVMDEGFKEVSWDGRDNRGNPVGSGVYFYRLTTGKRVLTMKMVLLK